MKAQSGFTLLELLVSLTLLGLLFVLLLGGLHFGVRAWERGSTTADGSDTVRLAQDLLRGEIERACPRLLPPLTLQPQAASPMDFAGAAGQMRFLAPAPQSADSQSCSRLALQVRPDGNLQRLVLLIGSNSGESTDLLRHAQSIRFHYLGTNGPWQDGWTRQPDLPALVRVDVTFAQGDARVWPELFVAPRISAEADCNYDAATKSCRGG